MNKRNRTILKIISLCVAFVFTHQQLVWAAGDMVLPAAGRPSRRYEALFDNAAPGKRSRGLGTIEDVHTQGDRSVINIQDCHSSLSAQYSIVDILSRLVGEYDLDLVAIEGGAGYIDTAALKSLPDEAVKNRTADFLMRNGHISAGEFFAATSNKDIALYGVEDNELYRKNLASFRRIHDMNRENLRLVRGLLEELREKERAGLNPELYRTVFKTRLHRKGQIGLDVYLEHLLESAENAKLDTAGLEEVQRFKECAKMEKDLDFEKATGQRNELVKRLMGRMDGPALKELIRVSLRFRNGKMEQTEYHLWLEEKARESDIGLEDYPEARRFMDYARNYSGINIIRLQAEINALRNKVTEAQIRTGEEERLCGLVRTVELLEGLFSVRLSPGDVDLLEKLLTELSVEQLLPEMGIALPSGKKSAGGLIRMAKKALRFYDLTRERDAAMLSNTIKAMRREKTRVAALISGGHHSGGLTELMKERGLSYLVFMPEYRDHTERPYVAVLTKKADTYKRAFTGGAYDLAIEAYFDTGDIDRLEEMFAYALGNLVRQGEDPARMAELWARRYERFFDKMADERVSAMDEKPITPSDFRKKLETARVFRDGSGAWVVAFGKNAFHVDNEGIERADTGTISRITRRVPANKVVAPMTGALAGVLSFLGTSGHAILYFFMKKIAGHGTKRRFYDFSASLKERGTGDYSSKEGILFKQAGFSSTEPEDIREHFLNTGDTFYLYFGPEGYRDEIEAFFVDNRITEMLELYGLEADMFFHVELSEAMSMRGADLMWSPDAGEIFMALLKRSPGPFADNAGNGLVGINRGVFEVLGGQHGSELLKVVLLVGITHELRHESGQTDEETLMEEDVRLATELAGRYGVNRREIVRALRDLTDESGFLKEMERAIREDPTVEEKRYADLLRRQEKRLRSAIKNVNARLQDNWLDSGYTAEMKKLTARAATDTVVEFTEQEDLHVPFRIKPGTESDPVFQVILEHFSNTGNEHIERRLVQELTYALPSVMEIKQRAAGLQHRLMRIARDWETLVGSMTEEGNEVRRIFKAVVASAVHIHYLAYSHLLEYGARQSFEGISGFPAESMDPSLASLFRRYADRDGKLNENVKAKMAFSLILPENKKQLVMSMRTAEVPEKSDLARQRWLLDWLKDPEYCRAKIAPDRPDREPGTKKEPTGPGGLSSVLLGLLASLTMGTAEIKAEARPDISVPAEEQGVHQTVPPANVDTGLDYERRLEQAEKVAGYAVSQVYSDRDAETRRNAFILLMATARHESDGFRFRKGRANGHDRGLVHVNRDTAYNIIRYAVDKRSRGRGPELAEALADVFNRVFDRQIGYEQLKHISRRQWGAYLVWSDVMAFSMACARLRWDRRALPDGSQYPDIDTYARAIADYWLDVYNRTTGYTRKKRFRERMIQSTGTLLAELRRNGYEPVGADRDWDVPGGGTRADIEQTGVSTNPVHDVPRNRPASGPAERTGVREYGEKEGPVREYTEPDIRLLMVMGSFTLLAALVYWLIRINRNIRRRMVRRGGKGPVYRAALRSELKRFIKNAGPGDVYTLPLSAEILRYPDIRKILASSENALNIGALPRTLKTGRKCYAIMMGKGHNILRGFGRKLSDYRVIGHMHPVEAGEQTDIFPGASDIWDALKTARETGVENHFILHREGITYYRVNPGRTRAPTPEEDVRFFSDMDDMSISEIKELLMDRFGVHIRVTGRHHEERITTRIVEHPFTAAAGDREDPVSEFTYAPPREEQVFETGKDRAPPVRPERDMKGRNAGSTDPVIRHHIRSGNMIELFERKGRLVAYRLRWVDDHEPGQTYDEILFADEVDVNSLLSSEEQAHLMDWIEKHPLPDGRGYVHFRVVRDAVALNWTDDTETVNISHAGYRDGCIYIGERLLSSLFREMHDPVRSELLDRDEYRHLVDETYDSREDMFEHQRRLNLVAPRITSILSDLPEEYGIEKISSHEKALKRYPHEDIKDPRIIRWGWFSTRRKAHRVIGMRPLQILSGIYVMRPMEPAPEKVMMKLWMRSSDSSDKWREQRMVLLHVNDTGGGNEYIFKGRIPAYFEGEYTVMFSVDGGKSWSWANKGIDDNRSLIRDIGRRRGEPLGYRRASGAGTSDHEKYRVIRLYDGKLNMNSRISSGQRIPERFWSEGVKDTDSGKFIVRTGYGVMELAFPEETYVLFTDTISSPAGEMIGRMMVYFDAVSRELIVDLCDARSGEKIPHEDRTRGDKRWGRARIRMPLDDDGNIRGLIHEKQLMGLSRAEISILLHYSDLKQSMPELLDFIEREMVLYHVDEQLIRREAAGKRPVPSGALKKVMEGELDDITAEDVIELENIIRDSKSNTLGTIALMCLRKLTQNRLYSREKYLEYAYELTEKRVLEGMATLERIIRQDTGFLGRLGLRREDIESVFLYWFISYRNKVIFRVTFRMKNGERRVMALEVKSPLGLSNEMDMAKVERTVKLWKSLSEKGLDTLPEVYALQKVEDYQPKFLDTPLPRLMAARQGDFEVEAGTTRNARVLHDDMLVVAREFIEGYHLTDYSANASSSKEEEGRVTVAGIKAYLRMWQQGLDPDTEMGPGLVDPDPRYVVVTRSIPPGYPLNDRYSGYVCELDRLEKGFSLSEIIAALNSSGYRKQDILQAAREVLDPAKSDFIERNYASITSSSALRRIPVNSITTDNMSEQDMKEILPRIIHGNEPAHPEDRRLFDVKVETALQIIRRAASCSERIPEELLGKLISRADAIRRGDGKGRIWCFSAYRGLDNGLGAVQAISFKDDIYLSDSIVSDPELGLSENITYMLMLLLLSRIKMEETNDLDIARERIEKYWSGLGGPGGIADLLMESAFDPGSCKRREGFAERSAVRAHIRAVMERKVLKRDLVDFQRLPDRESARKNAADFINALYLLVRDRPDIKSGHALEEFLSAEAGVRKFIIGGGKGTRFSPGGYMVKQLFKPDNYNTNIKMARLSASFGSLEDVAVVDGITVFNILKDNTEVGAGLKKAIRINIRNMAGILMASGSISSEEATKLVRAMGRIIERDLIYTVKEDGIKDLGFVIRQADKTIRNMLSADDTRVQFLVDKMSYAIFKVLLSDMNLIDAEKKNRLLGENCIVVLDSGDGHGSAYFEAISDLDRIGRLAEARYSVIIHGDSPGWGLDDYPNYIFITYLKMIAGFDPATPETPKVAIAVKNPDDGRARGRARVFLREDERFGMVPQAVKEWNDLSAEEKAEATAMAENRDRDYWTNGNILICDTSWASDKGGMFKRAFKHSLGEKGRVKRRMFEYWVSDLLNLAVGQQLRGPEEAGESPPWAMAVMIEGEAPNANKTLNRALDYSARMRNNLVDKVRSLGVEVDEDVNLSISPGAVDASYDIDKVLMDIFGDNLRERGKRSGDASAVSPGKKKGMATERGTGNTRLRGTIHLGSFVRIGRGAVLDGREKDVSLTGRSVVDRGVHVKGITARDAHLSANSSNQDTRLLVNGPVPGRNEALEATHLEDVPFADLDIIADKDTDIWLIKNDASEGNMDALKRIFGGVTGEGTRIRDQIFLSGDIILEDTVRVDNGTFLDGRGQNIILTGDTKVGSGVRLRGVQASDTVFFGPPVMDAYTYRQPSRETPPHIENSVFSGSVVEFGARAKEAFVVRSYLAEGSAVRRSDLDERLLGYGETVKDLRHPAFRERIRALLREDGPGYVPGMYRMREVPEVDAREIKAHQLRQACRNYARFVKDETLLKRLEEETRSFLNSRVSDHMTTQQIRRFVISKIRGAIDRYDLESKHKLRDPLRTFYPLSAAARDVAAELIEDMRAIDPEDAKKNREFFARLCVLSARYNLIDFSIDPAVFNTGDATKGVRGNKRVITDIVERNTAPVPAIDGIDAFADLVFEKGPGLFLFLPDNIGETEIDAVMWAFLLRMGHEVVVAPKDGFSYGDIQLSDVENIARSYPELENALQNGRLRAVSSGSSGEGTFLDLASDELTEILADSALTAVIGKGQANLFTLPARNTLRVPYVSLCLSKSRTSTRITGVPVGRRDDGSRFFRPVIAVVPEGQRITTPDGKRGFRGVISRFERNRIVGEDEEDEGHPLTIQRIRRFRRGALSLALALTLVIFGIYLSGSMSGIYVVPALAVPVLICLSLIRYYSLERGIQQAFKKYIFLDKALTGVLEEDEQTLARLNGEHIAERQSTGIVVFHEAFNFLSGKHQELVRTHEACRSCFAGMLVLWPFYGGALLKMVADHISGVWYGRATDDELKVQADYSDLEQALEVQLRNNIETEFLQEGYAGGAEGFPGPEGSDRTSSLKEGHPFVKILDLSGMRDVRSKTRMLQYERSHGRCTFCERAVHSEEAERAEAGGWSFSPDPNPVFPSQIVGINMKHVDQSVTGPEYFYDIFSMLKNLKGWKVAWPSRMGTGIPEHMHIHLFKRPEPLPVQSPVFESESVIFTDRTGEGVVSLLRGFPDPDNEAAVFTVEGSAARINKLTKRCGDVETIIRKTGMESDKLIVTEEEGRRIKVFFFPRTKRVSMETPRQTGITVGPMDLAGTWRVSSEERYRGLSLRDVVASIGKALVSLETGAGSALTDAIRQHFEESEGSGIFPPSMDLMVTYDCNLNCPVCWGSYMPKHHIFWPGGDIESIDYREGKKHHRDGRETDLGKEERAIKSKLESCFSGDRVSADIDAIVYETSSLSSAGKEEESRISGKGKNIRRLEKIQVFFEDGRKENLVPGSDIYNEMVLTVQKKMIDIMYDNGMRRMVFTGGEPLMNSNLPALLEHARSKGVTTWLFTNALLLTGDMADRIMPYVDMVSFSLDGPDEESNTRNRRKGHFTAVMRVLDLMEDYPDTQVQILTVVTARNRDRIRDIGALLRDRAKGLKGFQWKLNHYKRIGRSQKEHDIQADNFLLDYGEFKDLARSVQRQFSDMRVRYSPLDHDRAYLFVFPDGTLATTVGSRYEELGNILDPGVLEEEQNITVFREITDKIQERAIYIPTKEKAGTPAFKRRDLMGEEGAKIVGELHSGLKDKLDEHMERVSRIAVRIARRLRQKGEDITHQDIHVLRMAGLVHDIGAREKYEKDLEEARNRINAGISRDKVEPTRRGLVNWANEKAPLIEALDKTELEDTLAGAYRSGDFYPLYRMYIKYSALGKGPLDELTPKEERVAGNIFSHGGVSVEQLRDKGIGFPDILGLIVRYHHDYNSLNEKLSSLVLDGRMSPEEADKTRLLATVLILSDVLEQGNNYHRNTVLRGRQTETFDLTFDEFNGFIWKRFNQMEMIPDTRALEALKDLFVAHDAGVEGHRTLDPDLSRIIGESRGKSGHAEEWLREGDRRFMEELTEDRTTRMYIRKDIDIVIGMGSGLLKELGPDVVHDIRKIPYVSAVIGLKKSTERERLKELSERTWGTRAIAALIDEDVFRECEAGEELAREIKNTVEDFVDRARRDITGMMDPDRGQLDRESIERIRDIQELKEVMAVLMRTMPESRSYRLNELSLRQMRIERSFYALKSGPAGVRLTDRVLDSVRQYHLVHYADGDNILDVPGDSARAVMPPGLEIQRRRDKQQVSRRLDRFHDRFFITAPEEVITEAGKDEFRRHVMDLWMLNGVVPEEDVVILDHAESGYSAYEIFSAVKEQVPDSTVSNTGIRVIDGDLAYDDAAEENALLQVQMKEGASNTIDQYSVFVNLLVAGGKRWAYAFPGLEEGRGRLFIYIPRAQCIDLEKEIRSYHELYVKSVLVDA